MALVKLLGKPNPKTILDALETNSEHLRKLSHDFGDQGDDFDIVSCP